MTSSETSPASGGTGAARVVFVGDSITDAGRDRADRASLGDGYVGLVATDLRRETPGTEVVNVGIGGDRAVDLERRWQDDVVAAAPDVLSVYVGVNDTWRRFDADDPTRSSATVDNNEDTIDTPNPDRDGHLSSNDFNAMHQ
jgi:acyl-CoA thioesterase I